MSIQRFEYGIGYQVVRKAFAIMWLGGMIVILLGILSSIYSVLSRGPIENPQDAFLIYLLLLCPSLTIGGFLFVLMGLALSGILTMEPSISISEEGFKIRSFVVGESPWIRWDAITKVRKPFLWFSSKPFFMVGVKGIGVSYRVNGLLLRLGTGGFIIGSNIKGYPDLVKVLREKRPDLFD